MIIRATTPGWTSVPHQQCHGEVGRCPPRHFRAPQPLLHSPDLVEAGIMAVIPLATLVQQGIVSCWRAGSGEKVIIVEQGDRTPVMRASCGAQLRRPDHRLRGRLTRWRRHKFQPFGPGPTSSG
jgi:hypothetical protein